jgi:hypothetical protein
MNEKKNQQARRFLENLTSFITPNNRTKEELSESLSERGIDVSAALANFSRILQEHGSDWRSQARRDRLSAVQTVARAGQMGRQTREYLIQEIQNVTAAMQKLGAPVQAGAYFREFKEATDQDLESLLNDLTVQRDLLERKQNE